MTSKLEGVWYNQHGSKLELSAQEGGVLRGTFSSASGLAAKEYKGQPISGYWSNHLVAFVCNFGKFGSLTAWTGHLVEEHDARCIETQWQMAVTLPAPEQPDDLWRGTWTGSDVFRREAPASARTSTTFPSHPLPDWP